jgi:hypothetical protein
MAGRIGQTAALVTAFIARQLVAAQMKLPLPYTAGRRI